VRKQTSLHITAPAIYYARFTLASLTRPQIVSSAIANPPPPDGLVGVLHLLGRAGFTNKYTRNKMCKLFDAEGVCVCVCVCVCV
jgi:hypothetical protein